MRIAVATRIFSPEPSAASFRLNALAKAFLTHGDSVRVLTVKSPSCSNPTGHELGFGRRLRVTRFPVLRDRTGYVRGYLPYLSFDIPLFFRVLFGPRQDAFIVEPPPTSVFAVALASRVRRMPYFAYAADIWSDASASTGAPAFVVRTVRRLERFAWSRARGVFAVNHGVAERVRAIAPRSVVEVVGNGIDTDIFNRDGPAVSEREATGEAVPYAIYSGTASEWQGAEVFVQALERLQAQGTRLVLVFLGQGTSYPRLKQLAEGKGVPVVFHDQVAPETAATWQRGAVMSLASILPGAGYDFAYPTKLFASWGCGTPVVYAGPGPARAALEENPQLGIGVEYDADTVAEAMNRLLNTRPSRTQIAAWALENVSLHSVADRTINFTRRRLWLTRTSEGDRAE